MLTMQIYIYRIVEMFKDLLSYIEIVNILTLAEMSCACASVTQGVNQWDARRTPTVVVINIIFIVITVKKKH